jgi:hypothetical protein
MKRGKQEDLLCNDAVENSVCVQCPEKNSECDTVRRQERMR